MQILIDFHSFVFRRDTNLFGRRLNKINTTVVSTFTAQFVFNWPKYFPNVKLLYPPTFDGTTALLSVSGCGVASDFRWMRRRPSGLLPDRRKRQGLFVLAPGACCVAHCRFRLA